MTRLLSTIGWDALRQFRYGFYYAGAVVALVWIVLLAQLPREQIRWLLPAFLLANLNVTTFYFIGGLVLFEKGEGILEAVVVTPLRSGEYLLSKLVTLTLLATVENLLIVLLTLGPGFRPLPLMAGLIFMSVIYALIGFALIARYDTINEYLFPSFLFTALLQLPMFHYLGLWDSPLFYLFPLQAPLLLLKAAFQTVDTRQLIYAVLYSLFWIGLGYYWGLKAFRRFIVKREGVRAG